MVYSFGNSMINEPGHNIWYQSSSDPRELLETRGKSTYSDASRTLMVTIEEVFVPVTVEILHRVFDQFGAVEEIEIHAEKENLQAIVRFKVFRCANSAKISLDGRYKFDQGCLMQIRFLCDINSEKLLQQTIVLEKNYQKMMETLKLISTEVGKMISSPSLYPEKEAIVDVGFLNLEEKLEKQEVKDIAASIESHDFDEIVVEELKEMVVVETERQVLDEMILREVEEQLVVVEGVEVLVSNIEELATEKMGTNDISLNEESKELEEKETTVAVVKPMSEKMVVKEMKELLGVETVNKVFDDLPVSEINILVSTEIVSDMCGDWFLEESRGKVQKLPDGFPIDERVDCYPTTKDEETMICITFEPTKICRNEEHLRTVIKEIQEERCHNEGEFLLYCSFATGAYFMIDPGGFIVYRWNSHLFTHFTFKKGFDYLGGWSFDILRDMQCSSLVDVFGSIIVEILPAYTKLDHKYGKWCSLIDKNMESVDYCMDCSYLIISSPSHGNKSFSACMYEFHGNSQSAIKIKFSTYSGFFIFLGTRWKIIGFLWTFDLMGIGMNSLKWQLWTISQFAWWIFVCVRMLDNQVYVGGVNAIYLVGLISSDEMSKKEIVKSFKPIVEIFHFKFTQVLENLDCGDNWMKGHMIRLVQSLKTSLLESYLLFKESTKSTRKSVSLSCKNLNKFLNKGFLNLRYFIYFLKLICNGKGGKSLVKLELGESIVRKWDLVLLNVYYLVKIFRCNVLKIGEGFVEDFMIQDCLIRECCHIVQGWVHRFSVTELKHALETHLVRVIQQFYTEMQEILARQIVDKYCTCPKKFTTKSLQLLGSATLAMWYPFLVERDPPSNFKSVEIRIKKMHVQKIETRLGVRKAGVLHKSQFKDKRHFFAYKGKYNLLSIGIDATYFFWNPSTATPLHNITAEVIYMIILACVNLVSLQLIVPLMTCVLIDSHIESHLLVLELILKNCELGSLRTRIISTGEKCHDHDTRLGANLVFKMEKQGLIMQAAKTCKAKEKLSKFLYFYLRLFFQL